MHQQLGKYCKTRLISAAWALLALVCVCTAPSALAQYSRGYELSATPGEGLVGEALQFAIKRLEGGAECAVGVDYGDGEASVLRFTFGQTQLGASHTYSKAGGYKVATEGKLLLQGFGTALPCTGASVHRPKWCS